MAFLNPAEFALEVAKGNIIGHSRTSLIGKNPNTSSTESTTWNESTDYVFPAAASTMTVSSASANDATGGTGARTVLVSGLDSSYNEISETINPNGTTGTTTSNSYLRINRLLVVTAGSTGNNVGALYIGTGTITAGKPAVVNNVIAAAIGISTSGFFTTPAGVYVALVNSNATVDANRIVVTNLCLHTEAGVKVCGFETLISTNISLAMTWSTPLITPKIDVELRAKINGGTATVNVNLGLVLIDSALTTVTV